MKKRWTMAPLLALTLALSPVSLAGGAEQGGNNINVNSTLAAGTQKAAVGLQTADQARSLKSLTMDEALQLAEKNNINLQLAQFERDKKKAAAAQAIYQRRDVPDYLDRTKLKDQARVNEKQKQAELAVADRTYEVAKAQISLAVKNYYLNVLKAKDRVAVCQSALERAQEQERQAEVAFKVGTVAKNDVLAAQAGVSSAQAQLTAAQNTYKLAQIELSNNIGLPVDTQYNLITNVEYQPMGEVDLNMAIEAAQKTRLDIMKASSDIDVAKAYYDLVVGYSAAYTYDAKQAKAAVEQATLKLDDTKKTVASDLTKAYLNVEAAQKQLDAYTAAVENSKESLRLTQLRYQVGMATSLDVMNASVQLSQNELSRVEALYSHYLAKLSFETAQLAPLPASAAGQ